MSWWYIYINFSVVENYVINYVLYFFFIIG